jgi:hypothetical protein
MPSLGILFSAEVKEMLRRAIMTIWERDPARPRVPPGDVKFQ